ncbi:efflux RND transporter periplasmic adaptor subunit [Pararhizobium haloflavum]|uniref:efflux RND transporter periplasmic adaptor subunit n=1 Tax=Pararhizobium haloflavum TaxID=2037914 RepID=UPI000C1904DC|nr:efflux RND transporter periplasmic adaptor subunit [Pararhizobium haloflavum]
MSAFKQSVSALVILGVAGFAWIKLDPNAVATLASYNIDHPMLTALAPSNASETPQEGAGSGGGPAAAGPGEARMVVVAPAGTAEVNDRLTAIGDGEAVNSVNVTPYVTGNLDEVLVQSGQRVEAGDVLARLASEEQTIAVERARLDLENMENTLQRRQTLRDSSAAAISNVEVTEAELAVQTAQLELREAELNLSRRAITAPISGVIGIVSVNPGDYVTTDAEIVRIDDRSELLVDFWVPERFASMIEVGQPVSARAISNADRQYDGEIYAVDNRIDPESRTLWVRAAIPNEDDRLRAGMAFSVAMTFDGDTYPTVDPLSVQWSADGSFVWRIDGDRSERVPVRIVQRNSDSILVDADIEAGDRIITEGLMQLRDGATVMVANESEDQVGQIPMPVAENLVTRTDTLPARRPSGS